MESLFTPEECFHLGMDNYFEDDTSISGGSRCEWYCSFCTGSHRSFANTFCKKELIAVVCSTLSDGHLLKTDAFLKLLKDTRNTLYEPDVVPAGVSYTMLANPERICTCVSHRHM